MLKHYILELKPTQENNKIKSNFAYYLYAILLENCPNSFATEIHNTGFTPISHKLVIKDNKIIWEVSLFNEAIPILDNVLKNKKEWFIKKEKLLLNVVDIKSNTIDADYFFKKSREICDRNKVININFTTTTAFKRKGVVQNIPSNYLIMQSLFKKWNSVFKEAYIEDEDNEGIEAIALAIFIKNFKIKNSIYNFKGQSINGFQGDFTLTTYNNIDHFHKELAYALILFAQYCGIGIKTAMGMGGVDITY